MKHKHAIRSSHMTEISYAPCHLRYLYTLEKLHEMDLETDTYPADKLNPAFGNQTNPWKERAYSI